MTNYLLLFIVYGAMVVVAAALGMAVTLRKAFREKPIETPATVPPAPEAQPGGVLSYAPPVARPLAARRWPWLAGVEVVVQSVVLLAIIAGPAFAAYALGRLYPAHFMCAFVGTILTMGAVLVVAWRGLRREAGVPVAMTWPVRRLVLATLAMVLVLGLTFWAVLVRTDRMLERAYAEAAEASRRMRVVVPAGVKDAAELYAEAFDALMGERLPEAFDWQVQPYVVPESEATPPAFPPEFEPVVAKLHEAAKLPVADWGFDPGTPPPYGVMPHLNYHRTASRILRLHAIDGARRGEIDCAAADIQAMRAMAKHVAQGGAVEDALVAVGLDAQASATVQQVLPFVKTERDLDLLADDGGFRPRRVVSESLKVEREANRHEAVSMLRGEMGPPGGSMSWRLWRVCVGETELGDYDDIFGRLKLNADDDLPAAVLAVQRLERQELSQPRRTILAPTLIPSLVRSAGTSLEAEADQMMLQLGIAGTRYRLRTGQLPRKLEDLVAAGLLPAVPRDPFDGKPVRVRVKADEVIFYCVGYDLRDNGGNAVPGQYDPSSRVATKPLWELPVDDAPSTAPTTRGSDD